MSEQWANGPGYAARNNDNNNKTPTCACSKLRRFYRQRVQERKQKSFKQLNLKALCKI